MNLTDIAPVQTRYIIVPAANPDAEPGNDPCEWGTSWKQDATRCYNNITWAIKDTKTLDTLNFHDVPGLCVCHLCDEHIDEGFRITTV